MKDEDRQTLINHVMATVASLQQLEGAFYDAFPEATEGEGEDPEGWEQHMSAWVGISSAIEDLLCYRDILRGDEEEKW
jgi:hypothetical protein